MYEGFFGFERRPFSSVPNVEQYYPGTAIDTARQTLIRCIQRAEGTAMVVGPSGTGKTLLCQMLARHFRRTHAVVMLCRGRLSTRRALYQAILYELGRPYRQMDEGELRLSLIDYLTKEAAEAPRGLVLLVDEAHTLPLRLFEEIRMLTNLVRDGQPRVQLVMVGGPLLEERFASPKLDSFSQRLVARCYLESFDAEETSAYVASQLQLTRGLEIAVECEDEGAVNEEKEEEESEVPVGGIFLRDACQAVYHATDGIPRLVNQLCDHVLLLAFASGKRVVDGALVEEAWADLQQLPTPWNGEAESNEECNIIEFGGLDDEPEVSDEVPEIEAPPRLNLRAGDEEFGEAEQEIEQRLENLEQTLEGLEEEDEEDEDFKPAGSIGPEVELRFDEPANPFGEPFEEEEVVVDRYASAVTAAPPALPESDVQEETPAAEAIPPSVSEPDHDGAAAKAPPEPETVPMRRHTIEMVEPGDTNLQDADLIVVEEGYDDSAAPAPRPRVARRQEYRQLFAKLRRG